MYICIYAYIYISVAPICIGLEDNLLKFWIWIDYDSFFHSLISSSDIIWGENRRFPRCFLCLFGEWKCWHKLLTAIYCALYLAPTNLQFLLQVIRKCLPWSYMSMRPYAYMENVQGSARCSRSVLFVDALKAVSAGIRYTLSITPDNIEVWFSSSIEG